MGVTLTPTSVVVMQPTNNLQFGTPSAKVGGAVKIIHVRVTSTATDDSFDMANYGLTTNIFHIIETKDGVNMSAGTASTWSTTTITTNGWAGSGVFDMIVFGN